MKQNDVNFFPGWVRKSLTFTIDDGNIELEVISHTDTDILCRVLDGGVISTTRASICPIST